MEKEYRLMINRNGHTFVLADKITAGSGGALLAFHQRNGRDVWLEEREVSPWTRVP